MDNLTQSVKFNLLKPTLELMLPPTVASTCCRNTQYLTFCGCCFRWLWNKVKFIFLKKHLYPSKLVWSRPGGSAVQLVHVAGRE